MVTINVSCSGHSEDLRPLSICIVSGLVIGCFLKVINCHDLALEISTGIIGDDRSNWVPDDCTIHPQLYSSQSVNGSERDKLGNPKVLVL